MASAMHSCTSQHLLYDFHFITVFKPTVHNKFTNIAKKMQKRVKIPEMNNHNDKFVNLLCSFSFTRERWLRFSLSFPANVVKCSRVTAFPFTIISASTNFWTASNASGSDSTNLSSPHDIPLSFSDFGLVGQDPWILSITLLVHFNGVAPEGGGGVSYRNFVWATNFHKKHAPYEKFWWIFA